MKRSPAFISGSKNNSIYNFNRERLSKHIGQYTNKYSGEIFYMVTIKKLRKEGGNGMSKVCTTLKEAQLTVDKFLISNGKQPIYILKKVETLD